MGKKKYTIVKDRIIIKENELEEAVEELEHKFCSIINSLSENIHSLKNVIAIGDLDMNVYNEDNGHVWNKINILLGKQEEDKLIPLGAIEFSTYDSEAHVIYVNGNYEFVYVFELASYSCTDPYTLKNTGEIKHKILWTFEEMILERFGIKEK